MTEAPGDLLSGQCLTQASAEETSNNVAQECTETQDKSPVLPSSPVYPIRFDVRFGRVPKPIRKYLDWEPRAHINLFLSCELFEFEKKEEEGQHSRKSFLLMFHVFVCFF